MSIKYTEIKISPTQSVNVIIDAGARSHLNSTFNQIIMDQYVLSIMTPFSNTMITADGPKYLHGYPVKRSRTL